MDTSAGPVQNHVQAVFLTHGGGPMPILGEPSHDAMVAFMRKLPDVVQRPDIMVVISAHWESSDVACTVQTGAKPPMLYDYYGFPPEAYKVNYPARGHPELANAVCAALQHANISCRTDAERGFDHGVYVPLLLSYPAADIPCFQVSLLNTLDAGKHIALGRALGSVLRSWRPADAAAAAKPLRILLIGSGASYHGRGGTDALNNAFQSWLVETIGDSTTLSAAERERRLAEWARAVPDASRVVHPREEHLLPLHVCAGAANTAAAKVIFDDQIMRKRCVSFLWTL